MHAACINRVIGRWRVITSVRSTRIAWKRSRDIARTLNNIRVRVIVFVRQETKFQWYVAASLLYFRCNVHERNLPLRLRDETIPLSLRFFFLLIKINVIFMPAVYCQNFISLTLLVCMTTKNTTMRNLRKTRNQIDRTSAKIWSFVSSLSFNVSLLKPVIAICRKYGNDRDL